VSGRPALPLALAAWIAGAPLGPPAAGAQGTSPPVTAGEAAAVPATAAEPPALAPIPFPDLGQLEATVGRQLGAVQEALRADLAGEGATDADRATAFGDLGRLYHAYSFDEAAEACYRNAETLAPGDFRWPYLLGVLRQGAGRLAEADEDYRRALEIWPASIAAQVHRAEVAVTENRLDDAERILGRAMADAPDLPAGLALRGQIDLARGRYREAADRLEAALQAVPVANRLHYPLAMAYRGLGEEETARRHLARRGMIGLRPPDPLLDEIEGLRQGERVQLLRGRVAFRAGRFAEAAEAFAAALEARPDSVPARINLGATLLQLGDRAGAIDQFRAALATDPDNATAHYDLGALLVGGGDDDAALPHLGRAVELDPDDAEAQLQLAELLARRDRFADALPAYTRAARLTPADERPRLGGADALVRLGRYAEAIAVLEPAVAAMPTSGALSHALARLLAGSPDLARRDGERALDLAQRVFAAKPTAFHGETLAMALAEVGRCAEAAGLQRQVVEAGRAAAGDAADERLARSERVLAVYQAGPPCRYPVAP
jgi:tetratricopeptide (TPR) repeat protein